MSQKTTTLIFIIIELLSLDISMQCFVSVILHSLLILYLFTFYNIAENAMKSSEEFLSILNVFSSFFLSLFYPSSPRSMRLLELELQVFFFGCYSQISN